MWRVTFNHVDDGALAALKALAQKQALVPLVELHSPEELDQAAKMASEAWLVKVLLEKDAEWRIYTEKSIALRLRGHGWRSLDVIVRLTLEDFLRAKSGLELHMFAVMRDIKVTFADGADPAIFPIHPITDDAGLTAATVTHLTNRGVNSWDMFQDLTTGFLRSIHGIKQGRIDEIKEQLRIRGIALKA